jgi:toxin ParE1/3/4
VKQFKYANLAKVDLIDIGAYTSRMWGEAQAGLYIDQLEDCCQRLAQDPGIGRLWTPRKPGLRRMEQGRHVIFYQQQDSGILVYRILH